MSKPKQCWVCGAEIESTSCYPETCGAPDCEHEDRERELAERERAEYEAEQDNYERYR